MDESTIQCQIFNGSVVLSDKYRQGLDAYLKNHEIYRHTDGGFLFLPPFNYFSECISTPTTNTTDYGAGVSLRCQPRSGESGVNPYDCTHDETKELRVSCNLTQSNELNLITMPGNLIAELPQWCSRTAAQVPQVNWSCIPGAPKDIVLTVPGVVVLFEKCVAYFSGVRDLPTLIERDSDQTYDKYQFRCRTLKFEGQQLSQVSCARTDDRPLGGGTTTTSSPSEPAGSSTPTPPSCSDPCSITQPGRGSGGNKTGAIAAGVLGGLLLVSLIVLGIIYVRRRKDKQALKAATEYIQGLNNPNPGGKQNQIPVPRSPSSPPPLEGAYYAAGSTGKYKYTSVTSAVDTPSIPIPDATGGAIMLNTISVNAIDDAYATRTFDLITQEIKDLIGNYFDPRYLASAGATGTTTGSPSFPTEIRDIWKEISPSMFPSGEHAVFPPTSLFGAAATAINPRVRMLVLRATAWTLIQRAWRSGELIGRPGINNYVDDANRRGGRQEVFSRQISHPGYTDDQAAVTQSLMVWIDGILLALGNYTATHTTSNGRHGTHADSPSSSASSLKDHNPSATQAERHEALAGIIDRAASLCGKLGVQVADFKLVGGTSGNRGNIWDAGVMENIDGVVVGGGVHDQQDRKVKIVVAPGLVKWGDSRGDNRNQRLVLVREKVFLGGE